MRVLVYLRRVKYDDGEESNVFNVWCAQSMDEDMLVQADPGETASAAVARLGYKLDMYDLYRSLGSPPPLEPAAEHLWISWARSYPCGVVYLGASRQAEVRAAPGNTFSGRPGLRPLLSGKELSIMAGALREL